MGRSFEDLSGRQFGELTVLNRAPNRVSSNGNLIVMYHCRCSCGKETEVRATALKSGKTSSCGCSRKKSMAGVGLDDLIGRTFGRWTVLYRVESAVEPSGRKATMWHCRCECGTERDIRAGSLKGGTTFSCGCYKHEVLSSGRDLSNQVFGRWTVIGRAPDKYSEKSRRNWTMWHCRCECGTERDVSERSLVTGQSVSCGCYRKERHADSAVFEDLSGRTFGHWTVLERAPDRFYPGGGRAQMWRCRCECGQVHIVAGNMLKAGISQSCGCFNMPRAELHVQTYLDTHGMEYEFQKTYPGLVGVGGKELSYDFLVYKNGLPFALIECQGEQHFRPVKYFGGDAKFEVQQEHDVRKKDYAASIGLKLIEVLYDCRTYDDISLFLQQNL